MPKYPTKSTYPALLKALREVIAAGKARASAALEREKITTYHTVGKLISEDLLANNDRAAYGARLYILLADDLFIDDDTLRRAVQFYRLFPNYAARRKLDWSHYKMLVTVKDDTLRKQLEQKAITNGWVTRELEQEIKKHQPLTVSLARPGRRSGFGQGRLRIERGALYAYRLIRPKKAHPGLTALVIDQGFSIYRELDRRRARHYSAGAVVASSPEGEGFRFRKQSVSTRALYTYTAYIDKVIDGDTVWVMIDCGFDTWTRQKLRLRGIDTPELKTPKGEAAKRFVEHLSKQVEFVVIKTYGGDKYNRYLTDIFYAPDEPDPFIVAKKGVYLNQQLLDEGLAKRM